MGSTYSALFAAAMLSDSKTHKYGQGPRRGAPKETDSASLRLTCVLLLASN